MLDWTIMPRLWPDPRDDEPEPAWAKYGVGGLAVGVMIGSVLLFLSPIIAADGGGPRKLALVDQPAAETCAKIVVHDGDTLRCDGQRIRLVAASGPVDTPELPGSPRCHHCDPAPGYAARDRLKALLRSPAHLHCDGTDRYQRRLCRITVNGRDVGDMLVAEGHAVIRDDWR